MNAIVPCERPRQKKKKGDNYGSTFSTSGCENNAVKKQ